MDKPDAVHRKGGAITEIDPGLCTVRARIPAGELTLDQLRGITRIAKKYGAEGVHLTTRQTIEIPHLKPADLEKIAADLAKNTTPLGAEHDEVVNIVACPGTDRCKYANVDTLSLARALDERFFGREEPMKVRITLTACPNGCNNALLNEIGIIGRVLPERIPGICTGCGSCVEYCREGAIRIKNGISVLNPDTCIQCGICVKSCPFDVIKAVHRHYQIRVGGRSGRHPKVGRELVLVEREEQVVEVVEKILYWIYRRGRAKGLLAEQLDEMDFAKLKAEVQQAFPAFTG